VKKKVQEEKKVDK